MKIDKKKCNAWVEILLAIQKMSKELTDNEFEYIRANFHIAFEKLKLKELEDKR